MKTTALPLLLTFLPFFAASCDKPADAARKVAVAAEMEAKRTTTELETSQAEVLAAEQRIRALELQELELRGQIEQEKLTAMRSDLEVARQKLASEQADWAEKQKSSATMPKNPTSPAKNPESLEPVAEIAPVVQDDYQLFYEELTPHGEWFQTRDYGYVWQPNAVKVNGWQPYTRGRWAPCDQGWTWISEEPFGWACYHYGRWTLLRDRGWIWVPGSVWAPAWVDWRKNDGNIGWCPLPPETAYWDEGSYGATVDVDYGLSPEWYSYVPASHFCEPVYEHYLPRTSSVALFSTTVCITNVTIKTGKVHCHGPEFDWIKKCTGRPLKKLELACETKRGRADRDWHQPRIAEDSIHVFTPKVNAAWNPRLKPNGPCGTLEVVEQVRRKETQKAELVESFRQRQQAVQRSAEVAVASGLGKKIVERQDLLAEIRQQREQISPRNRAMIDRSDRGSIRPAAQKPAEAPVAVETKTNLPNEKPSTVKVTPEIPRATVIQEPVAPKTALTEELRQRETVVQAKLERLEEERNRLRNETPKAKPVETSSAAPSAKPVQEPTAPQPPTAPPMVAVPETKPSERIKPSRDSTANNSPERPGIAEAKHQAALEAQRRAMQDEDSRRDEAKKEATRSQAAEEAQRRAMREENSRRDEAQKDAARSQAAEEAQRRAMQEESSRRDEAQKDAAKRQAAVEAQRRAMQEENSRRDEAQKDAAKRQAAAEGQRRAMQEESSRREQMQRRAEAEDASRREQARRESEQRGQQEAKQRQQEMQERREREMSERRSQEEKQQREGAERQREAAERSRKDNDERSRKK